MWAERVGYARLVDVSGHEWMIAMLYVITHGTIESFTYTSSLRKGISITLKVTSPLGYSMDFVLLNLMTQKPNILPRIAAETKDNSWPFETGIPLIGFKNHRILIDMMILCTATR